MAERPSWAVSVAGGLISVEDARAVLAGAAFAQGGSLVTDARSGFLPGPPAINQGQVTATGTPNSFVHVAPFHRIQQSTRGKGPYVMCLDVIKDIDILSTPAHATNQRNDLIIAQQSDAFYGDANSLMSVKQVVGTPAGSPVDPVVTGSPDYVLLARVRVPALATTIVSGNIDDLRTIASTTASGGIIPVNSTTERSAITSPYDGMTIWRAEHNWVETYDGGGWRVLSVPTFGTLADITSIVTTPYTGQFAYAVTDGALYRWTGSVWLLVMNMLGGLNNARYEQTSTHSIANTTDTKARFQTVVDSAAIVVPSGTGNIDFALNRTGLWMICASVAYASVAAAGERHLFIVKSSDVVGTRYGGVRQLCASNVPMSLSCTVTRRFTSGDSVSALMWQNSGLAPNTDASFGEAFAISFVWMGP